MKILDRLQELEQAATPGPWKTARNEGSGFLDLRTDLWRPCRLPNDDTQLIAALRNAAPALIRVARAAAVLKEEIENGENLVFGYGEVSDALQAIKELEAGVELR